MADPLPGLRGHHRIGHQGPTTRQDVVHHDVAGQGDGLPVGNLVIGGDGRAVGGVVAERPHVADEAAVLVGHLAVAPAMSGRVGDARLDIDVAGVVAFALVNLHPGVHQNPGSATAAVGAATGTPTSAANTDNANPRIPPHP